MSGSRMIKSIRWDWIYHFKKKIPCQHRTVRIEWVQCNKIYGNWLQCWGILKKKHVFSLHTKKKEREGILSASSACVQWMHKSSIWEFNRDSSGLASFQSYWSASKSSWRDSLEISFLYHRNNKSLTPLKWDRIGMHTIFLGQNSD